MADDSPTRQVILIRFGGHLTRGVQGGLYGSKQAEAEGTSTAQVHRRVQGLRGRGRRQFVQTTDSSNAENIAPNVLNREFKATAPNEKWVGDVTYLRTPGGWLYLAVILDIYSRLVVGWALSTVNDRHLAKRALDAAVVHRAPPEGLLHHTDQGSPYASGDYTKALRNLGFEASMSRRGNCYDNAVMESFFNTLKVELGERFESAPDAERKLFDYIEVFYNGVRIHTSIGFVSPRAFERAGAK